MPKEMSNIAMPVHFGMTDQQGHIWQHNKIAPAPHSQAPSRAHFPPHPMARPDRVARRPRSPAHSGSKCRITIPLEELSKYFDKPIVDASRELNVSVSVLQKICRANGVSRWPYRKLKSVSRQIQQIENNVRVVWKPHRKHKTVIDIQKLMNNNNNNSSYRLYRDSGNGCPEQEEVGEEDFEEQEQKEACGEGMFNLQFLATMSSSVSNTRSPHKTTTTTTQHHQINRTSGSQKSRSRSHSQIQCTAAVAPHCPDHPNTNNPSSSIEIDEQDEDEEEEEKDDDYSTAESASAHSSSMESNSVPTAAAAASISTPETSSPATENTNNHNNNSCCNPKSPSFWGFPQQRYPTQPPPAFQMESARADQGHILEDCMRPNGHHSSAAASASATTTTPSTSTVTVATISATPPNCPHLLPSFHELLHRLEHSLIPSPSASSTFSIAQQSSRAASTPIQIAELDARRDPAPLLMRL